MSKFEVWNKNVWKRFILLVSQAIIWNFRPILDLQLLILAETPTWVCFESCKSKKWLENSNYCLLDQSNAPFQDILGIDFELWQLPISKPVDLEKNYVPQKNAVNSGKWKQFWNWKNFCHGRLHTSFSKSNAFSVFGALPRSGWGHAQFLTWF